MLRKESLNTDDQQFHQYQQLVTSHLHSFNIKQKQQMAWDKIKECGGATPVMIL